MVTEKIEGDVASQPPTAPEPATSDTATSDTANADTANSHAATPARATHEPAAHEPPGTPQEPKAPRQGRTRRFVWPAAEVFTSVAAALLLTWTCRFIKVDPLDRVGQVSGLAAVQFRFAVLAGVVIAALLIAHFRFPASRPYLARLGCAAAAGLATGAIAGAIVFSLRGTPYGLWAGMGDFEGIFAYLRALRDGKPTYDHYPPLFMYMIGAVAWLQDTSLAYTLKDFQIVGAALYGPMVYAAWRLVLKPGWALGIGVVASLPVIEPLKPYREVVLVVMVPVLIAFVRRIRRINGFSVRQALFAGGAFGAAFGILFLLYSGWFVWFGPGLLLALAVLAPWRQHAKMVLLTLGVSAVTFTVVSWIHLRGLLAASGGVNDPYMYFDTYAEPAYIAMWRNDRPIELNGAMWPPPGELANVGLFTVLLAAGIGIAVWLGWRSTAVVTLLCGCAGAWAVRMYLASQMYESQLVRLYPRTTMILLYSMLILVGLGIMYASANGRAIYEKLMQRPWTAAPVGLLLVPLLFFFASAGSAFMDRYMPDNRLYDYGYFAWIAQTQPQHDGTCSFYAIKHGNCGADPID